MLRWLSAEVHDYIQHLADVELQIIVLQHAASKLVQLDGSKAGGSASVYRENRYGEI